MMLSFISGGRWRHIAGGRALLLVLIYCIICTCSCCRVHHHACIGGNIHSCPASSVCLEHIVIWWPGSLPQAWWPPCCMSPSWCGQQHTSGLVLGKVPQFPLCSCPPISVAYIPENWFWLSSWCRQHHASDLGLPWCSDSALVCLLLRELFLKSPRCGSAHLSLHRSASKQAPHPLAPSVYPLA